MPYPVFCKIFEYPLVQMMTNEEKKTAFGVPKFFWNLENVHSKNEMLTRFNLRFNIFPLSEVTEEDLKAISEYELQYRML